MDSEILLFGLMNLVGGVLAVFFIQFYDPLPAQSTVTPQEIYALAQRDDLPPPPLQP